MARSPHLTMLMVASICIFSSPIQADEITKQELKMIVVKEIKKVDTLNEGYPTITSNNNDTFKIKDRSNPLLDIILPGTKLGVILEDISPLEIKRLVSVAKPATKVERILALGSSFVLLFLLSLWASKGNPSKYIIGLDERYSNSKTQVVLWFGTLWVVYLATLELRVCLLGGDFLGGVEIGQNLLALSGLSALTYGAAKAITSQQVASDPSLKKPTNPPKFPDDLFQSDDKKLDLGDSQMFFITLLAVTIFLLTSFNFLGWVEYKAIINLPDVDTTLLSAFGLGQGAYLLKKVSQ